MIELEQVSEWSKRIISQVSAHIIGQEELIEDTVICLMAGGNLLLEGVPGLGKTRLVSVLGQVLGLEFKRIQFTPDLMPADITGTNIYNRDRNLFEFQQGPVFSNIVLADEINRATPKTQAAMLEAMQEKTVTVAGQTYILPKPYLVMATQNPIEQEGTYPLPEAQMDRFMFKLNVLFPKAKDLAAIVNLTTGDNEPQVQTVTNSEELIEIQHIVKTVPVAQPVLDYAMRLIVASHPDQDIAPDIIRKYVIAGASPRGAQGIINAARVRALINGRYNVSFEDIKSMAEPILRHRLSLNFEAMSDGVNVEHIIRELVGVIKE